MLEGETIPHREKAFSVHAEHTRWISKGKAGTPVELGVPVCVLDDGNGFELAISLAVLVPDIHRVGMIVRE